MGKKKIREYSIAFLINGETYYTYNIDFYDLVVRLTKNEKKIYKLKTKKYSKIK